MKMLEGELKRLDSEKIPIASIEKIKEFLTYLKSREELSDKRLYFYSNYLRTIARTMGDKFVNPTEQDIEKALMDQNACRKTKGVDEYNQITLIYNTGNSKIRYYDWNKKCKCPNLNRTGYSRDPAFLSITIFPLMAGILGIGTSTLILALAPATGLVVSIFLFREIYGYENSFTDNEKVQIDGA